MVQSFRRSRWANTQVTRMHQHGAAVPVLHHGTQDINLASDHILPADLLHIHRAPLSLPDQRDRHTPADDRAPAAGAALRAQHALRVPGAGVARVGHACVAACAPGVLETRAQFVAVLDGFLRRCAARLESLVLIEPSNASKSFLDLPADFWDAFLALRLLGVKAATLERQDWAGWTVVPPTTVPRVLVAVTRGGYGQSCTAEVDLS